MVDAFATGFLLCAAIVVALNVLFAPDWIARMTNASKFRLAEATARHREITTKIALANMCRGLAAAGSAAAMDRAGAFGTRSPDGTWAFVDLAKAFKATGEEGVFAVAWVSHRVQIGDISLLVACNRVRPHSRLINRIAARVMAWVTRRAA